MGLVKIDKKKRSTVGVMGLKGKRYRTGVKGLLKKGERDKRVMGSVTKTKRENDAGMGLN